MSRYLKYIIPVLIPLIILLLPASLFPFEGLTILQQRVIAIFSFAALSWIFEPIPVYATSVVIIALELLMVSDKGLYLFRNGEGLEGFGRLLHYSDIMATFASPIIVLFLGGFFLAMAATKYHLDINLARVLMRPFGTKPHWVMLGLMTITAVFSMFMSNTATTAMMLSILTPVLALFGHKDLGRIAFALCIPFAANIGGIGTPIGTPPNAIALRYLVDENHISFGQWMVFGVPYVIVLLAFTWVLLNVLYPVKQKYIKLEIEGTFLKTPKAITVYVISALTILLWLTGSIHGMNSYTVAIIPVTVFSITGIINKEDLKRIPWDVLWLVSGGLALGLALEETGLANLVVQSIPFGRFSPYVLLVGAALLCLTITNFISNTGTANLFLPIMSALGASTQSLVPLGGSLTLILVVTFAASLGMVLPISTPPNALAHATGNITIPQMARMGIIIGIVGVALSFVMIWILRMVGRI